jgi:hypothetical protein
MVSPLAAKGEHSNTDLNVGYNVRFNHAHGAG